MQKSYNSY